MKKYIPNQIEPKWQKKWAEDKLYATEQISSKPKKYVLDMFPYPSGEGMHVGHFKLYTASDVLARYFRFQGFNVLHPMGWDAFGLPAENYAIQKGVHPSITTKTNISNIKSQMQLVGFSYDWDREINTTDPNYYKWTQWIFLKLFEAGLAYEQEAPINWCPKDKTGLANEEVVGGVCERCGSKVEKKMLKQWILRITKYADRLIEDLDGLDWPEFIKQMQINWIGRSEGVLLEFKLDKIDSKIEVFTTALDTVFGVTFMVLSPEHPLVGKITTDEQKDKVEEYIKSSQKKSEIERTSLEKNKTGVFTGAYCINPFSGEKVPVWIADYVLMSYGTGAVMGVPGHDSRDHEFAKKYQLPIKAVIKPKKEDNLKLEEDGFWDYIDIKAKSKDEAILFESGDFNGLTSIEAKQKMEEFIEEKVIGKRKVQYHLRDWIFSRQRYWGEPIPLVHCPKCGTVGIPESELPLKLPEVEKYEPSGTGESPLATIPEWVNTTCPKCGGSAKRETNTMPQWAGSCWYYLRFIDPKNDKALVDKELEKYWMMVDWYLGGAEHAVLHLLYARFWHKFLYDLKVVSTKEPFKKLSSIGLVLASDGRKMSKRWGNVVRPEDVVKEYGADALRVYETFMGPFENTIAWNPGSINGVYNFLKRTWGLQEKVTEGHPELASGSLNMMHSTIAKVTQDIESLKLNTPIAALMEWLNYLSRKTQISQEEYKTFLILLAPFAPHITEELWQSVILKRVQDDKSWSIHQQSWPLSDSRYMQREQIEIAIQVNGKLRDTLVISSDIKDNEKDIEKMALQAPKIQKLILDKPIVKTIYVSGKIINFVV